MTNATGTQTAPTKTRTARAVRGEIERVLKNLPKAAEAEAEARLTHDTMWADLYRLQFELATLTEAGAGNAGRARNGAGGNE